MEFDLVYKKAASNYGSFLLFQTVVSLVNATGIV